MKHKIEALLSSLEGVKPAGDGKWYARCPAHDDKSPSLSIKDTGERVLIYCFAGCCAEDVVLAAGLTWKDLYPDKWDAAYASATCGKVSRDDVRRIERTLDPTDHERMILKVIAEDIRSGKVLSAEDRARAEVTELRLRAAQGGAV